MNQHTPGPWRVLFGNQIFTPPDDIGVSLLVAECNAIRAACSANARLIASAPELLQTLQALVAELDIIFSKRGEMSPEHRQARELLAAVAQATA